MGGEHLPELVLVANTHRHGARIGGLVLVLILLGVVVYFVVRLRRRGRGHDATEVDQHGSGPAVTAPADQGGGTDVRAVAGESAPTAAAGVLDGPTPGDVHRASPVEGRDRAAPRSRPARPLDGSADGWAVETHGLTKRFGDNVAVDDVELLVPRGCAFGYLGPNGAGKTTLIRTLLGLTKADDGSMSLLGLPVPAQRSRALARVGAIVDEPRFHGHLSGQENLQLLAAARGGDAGDRIAPALQRVGLGGRADHKVASYSMGMRQRLGVAACLLGDPELLILDEPMNGLDPAGMQEMRSMIETLVDEGRTVMLSSHLLDEVERTCDAVAIVDRGKVVRQGSIDDLVRSANTVIHVGCSDPATAARVITEARIGAEVDTGEFGLTVTLPAGSTKELVAEVNRRLVEHGIAVFSIQEVRTTLEDWFLSVTSRFGAET